MYKKWNFIKICMCNISVHKCVSIYWYFIICLSCERCSLVRDVYTFMKMHNKYFYRTAVHTHTLAHSKRGVKIKEWYTKFIVVCTMNFIFFTRRHQHHLKWSRSEDLWIDQRELGLTGTKCTTSHLLLRRRSSFWTAWREHGMGCCEYPWTR